MQIVIRPERKDWEKVLSRPVFDTRSLEATVANILKEVKENGDEAVKRFSLMFDKVSLTGSCGYRS